MSANFTPNMKPYKNTGSFKFWCQKVLPLVYDDSLSYYETLCKVVNYLNDVIQNVDNLNDNVDSLLEAYKDLQDYVNDYFTNLDVQEEINNKLDVMAEDGTLSALVSPFVTEQVTEQIDGVVASQIGDVVESQIDDSVAGQIGEVVEEQLPSAIGTQVTDWLNQHIQSSETPIVIDDTLTISGACADAKATGDAISDLKGALNEKVGKIGYKEVDELNTTFFTIGNNRYNVNNVTDGVQINQTTDGTHEQSGFTTTNSYVYVGDLNNIHFMRLNAAGTAYIEDSAYYQLYDADYQRIGNRGLSSTVDVSSATWMKVSNSTQYKSTFMILNTSVNPTDYIPYQFTFNYFNGSNPKETADKVAILERQGLIQHIDIENVTLGKYYEHNTNVKNTTTSAGILAPIRIYKNVKYSYQDLYAYFCNIQYDGSSSYEALSAYSTPSLQNGNFIPQADGYLYVTLSVDSEEVQGDPELFSNYVIPMDEIIIKPTTGDILQVLIDNEGKNIYFSDGNYDVINIYKAHYGNDFFDNYAGYSGQDFPYCGLPVYRGTKMTFAPNAIFTANYTGNNTSVRQNFSAFAFKSDVTFDGLKIVASGIRNIIHDDFDNSYAGVTEIKNCQFKHDYIIIAGGMGVHELVTIHDNVFERTDETSHVFDFSYHQNESSSAKNELIIKDNYCSKGISIRYYGTSELISDCLISNNSIANEIEYRAENSTALIQNIRVLKWNNPIRN